MRRQNGGTVRQTTEVRARSRAILLIVALGLASCADAPEPGNLAAFCSQLERGSGLTSTPESADLELLVTYAPPAIRPTIEALQERARDFDELLAEDPPNLASLFNARFDPAASTERDELDDYAESSCGIVVDRPPPTRWNNYLRENHADDPWAQLVTTQFEVVNDRIQTATVVFVESPEPVDLVEEACRAVSDFLITDGAAPGRVRVLIGSVVALEYDSPEGVCRLP